MKKLFGFILLLLLVALGGCNLQTKTLTEFYEEDLKDVTKVVIVDGSTGYKKTVTDHNIINEFLGEIKDIKFVPQENQAKRSGFRYAINLYQDSKETFQFSLNQINGHYYHTDPDIYPIVDKFYTTLDVEEEKFF